MKKKISRFFGSKIAILIMAIVFTASVIAYRSAIAFVEDNSMSTLGEVGLIQITVMFMTISGITFIGLICAAIKRMFIKLFQCLREALGRKKRKNK